MRITIVVVLSAFVFGSVASSQESVTTLWDFHTKAFYSSASVRFVKIESANRETITLEVPRGLHLAVYCAKEPTRRTEDQTPVEFQGMISVRTKPASEIVDGRSMAAQMDVTPLRIDLDNAKVTVEIKK